jgi:long-subunit fatty acid transport protein
LGGAFIAIADDATAAAVNPAGLAFLLRPEISLSHVMGMQARDYPVGGPDQSIATHRDRNPLFDQTLVNIAYPQWGFTFALYRQLAFNADFDFTRQQFLTFAPNRPLTLHEQLGASGNFPGMTSNFSLQAIHNAFVVAKTVHRRLRLGLTIAATQFRLHLNERHYFDPELWSQTQFDDVSIGDNRAESLYRLYDLELNQFKTTWSAGLLLELDPALTVGVVYQQLPSFDAATHRLTLPSYSLPDRTPADSLRDFAAQEGPVAFAINLPDNLGAGFAWKPSAQILVALDAVWHRNHSLITGLNLNLPEDDRFTSDDNYIDPDGKDDVETKDVFSFHGGLEYSLIKGKTVLPLRLGFYTQPNFGLIAATSDTNLQREYPDDSPRLHFTSGISVAIQQRVRFEVSLDLSSVSLMSIGSVVVRF